MGKFYTADDIDHDLQHRVIELEKYNLQLKNELVILQSTSKNSEETKDRLNQMPCNYFLKYINLVKRFHRLEKKIVVYNLHLLIV
jgi:hypothetical protein